MAEKVEAAERLDFEDGVRITESNDVHEIGRLVVSDAELILRGLPPRSCKRAELETVGRLLSKSVDTS